MNMICFRWLYVILRKNKQKLQSLQTDLRFEYDVEIRSSLMNSNYTQITQNEELASSTGNLYL